MRRAPANVYAERVVLGCIAQRGDRWREIADSLDSSDFATESHRLIWSAYTRIAARGDGIDLITLHDELARSQQLDSVGGIGSLAYLTDGVPDLPNLASYVRIVREQSTRRRVIAWAEQLQQQLSSADYSIDALPDTIRAMASQIASDDDQHFARVTDIIDANGGLDAYVSRRIGDSIPFPWRRLNEHTGGMRPGQLIVIAAETGGGKTAFAGNIAQHVALSGRGVILFSLEMSREEVCDRQLALAGRFNSRVFRHQLSESQADRVMQAAGRLLDANLHISDTGQLTVSRLIGSIERLRAKHRVDLVIVDYLQLMQARGQSIVEQVANIARGLKNAASELKIPIIALSQFAKAKVGETRQGADLKYGYEIAQAANLILILDGKTQYVHAPSEWLEWTLLIDKQRDGESKLKLEMLWRRDCGWFREAGETEEAS